MYRPKDLKKLKEEISNIAYEAEVFFKTEHEEPKLNEYKEYIEIIKKIVKKNDLIVYGGYAQNDQIIEKKKNDGFYKKWEKNDYELYSPEPVKYAMEIADELYKKNFF